MIGPAHQQWRGLIGPAVQAGSRQSAANTGWRRGIGPSGLEGKHDRGVLGTVLEAKIRQEQTPVMHTHRLKQLPEPENQQEKLF